jgi:hypothetical protein
MILIQSLEYIDDTAQEQAEVIRMTLAFKLGVEEFEDVKGYHGMAVALNQIERSSYY